MADDTQNEALTHRADGTESSTASLARLSAAEPASDLRRRLTYMMFFRVVLISLVLGATTLLHWLGDIDLSTPASIALYTIVGVTYLLTIIYALLLKRAPDLSNLASIQLYVDVAIATVLIHATGGAQSAYTFLLPLSVIGAATVRYRRGAVIIAALGAAAYISVSLLGWTELLPPLEGQRITPGDLSSIELGRAMALNLTAIIAVGFLAVNLGGQLTKTSAQLESHQSAAADLLTLHEDIVRCLSSGLITVDHAGWVSTVNEAACEILGTTADQVSGTHIEALSPELASLLNDLPLDAPLRRTEVSRMDGNTPVLVLGVSISPLSDHLNDVRGRIINFQDLTDMRVMEAEVKQAERLAQIGSLAAGVAHEIRNPLASISGAVELLRDSPQVDDDSRALMDIVTREIDRLTALNTELLDYANPRPLQQTEVDLTSLLAETVLMAQRDPLFESAKLSLAAQSQREPLHISADPEKLRQLLWNLLKNGAEAASARNGKVTVSLQADKEWVEIEIEDEGPGIAPDQLERIFDPFYTTKSKGTGLGLATVHNITTDHGGTIRVRSEPGKGSSFIVRLPYTGAHGE